MANYWGMNNLSVCKFLNSYQLPILYLIEPRSEESQLCYNLWASLCGSLISKHNSYLSQWVQHSCQVRKAGSAAFLPISCLLHHLCPRQQRSPRLIDDWFTAEHLVLFILLRFSELCLWINSYPLSNEVSLSKVQSSTHLWYKCRCLECSFTDAHSPLIGLPSTGCAQVYHIPHQAWNPSRSTGSLPN